MADFVATNGVGIVLSSLKELPHKLAKLSEHDFNTMKDNARRLKAKLEKGGFLADALAKAE